MSQHEGESPGTLSTSPRNVHELYRHKDEGVRPGFSDSDEAKAYYSRYVSFVDRHLRRSSTMLDIGCGSGWSTSMFRQAGIAPSASTCMRRRSTPPWPTSRRTRSACRFATAFSMRWRCIRCSSILAIRPGRSASACA